MRVIVKGKEPASLVEFRSAPGGNYDGYKDKDTLRRCLVKEQRGLAAIASREFVRNPAR